ncbi:hypothetical protein DL98DRAFT_525837 [Cadophora sp. DSE1049]|nr:hypothetical protein DL98DRAFT_525837 [Cadophora sp. DSE1049]
MLLQASNPALNIHTGHFPSWWPAQEPRTGYTEDLSHALGCCKLFRVIWASCSCRYIYHSIHVKDCPTISVSNSSNADSMAGTSASATASANARGLEARAEAKDPSRGNFLSASNNTRYDYDCAVTSSFCEIREGPGLCESCAELREHNAPSPLPHWVTPRWLARAGNDITAESIAAYAARVLDEARDIIREQNEVQREEVLDRESDVANAWYDFIYLNGPPEGIKERETHLEGVPHSGFYHTYGAPHLSGSGSERGGGEVSCDEENR